MHGQRTRPKWPNLEGDRRGALRTEHELAWKTRLTEHGHTCMQLEDGLGRCWAWVINASRVNWTAHVGSFNEGRAWVDETLATDEVALLDGTLPR